MMTQDTIDRYQTGGDIWGDNALSFGQAGADAVAAAALTGDATKVNAAMVQAKYGAPLQTSTGAILYQQLTTDPLAAPLASANKVLSNTALSFLKSPMVLLVIAAALFFFVFDGLTIIKNKIKG